MGYRERLDVMIKGYRYLPFPAWKIDREGMYKALGLKPNGHIPVDYAWQGKVSVPVGTGGYLRHTFEVRVLPSATSKARPYTQHRIHVRCPHCHTWTPFGRLHQHILSKRCLATAFQLPAIPSLKEQSQ